MKITSLLTQYLYSQQRLDLPGIGSFILDSTALPTGNQKSPVPLTNHIRFEYRTDLPSPTALIQFISEETGKMKALASSDLDSFVELAQQFLNIGKPFTLDGIGTLVKLKPGEFEFTPAPPPVADRRRESAGRDTTRATVREETSERYESFLSEKKPKEGWRKPVLAIVILAGLGLAIWGGYQISQKQTSPDPQKTEAASQTPEESVTPVASPQPADSTDLEPPAPSVNEYTYVLEVASQQRALKRYNQLRTNLWDVKLSTADSVNYKLYMNLPVNYGDTTHIKDSLRIMLGRPVYIEPAR